MQLSIAPAFLFFLSPERPTDLIATMRRLNWTIYSLFTNFLWRGEHFEQPVWCTNSLIRINAGQCQRNECPSFQYLSYCKDCGRSISGRGIQHPAVLLSQRSQFSFLSKKKKRAKLSFFKRTALNGVQIPEPLHGLENILEKKKNCIGDNDWDIKDKDYCLQSERAKPYSGSISCICDRDVSSVQILVLVRCLYVMSIWQKHSLHRRWP